MVNLTYLILVRLVLVRHCKTSEEMQLAPPHLWEPATLFLFFF